MTRPIARRYLTMKVRGVGGLALAAALTCALLAGCSSSGSSSGGTGGGNGPTINIGAIGTFSGAYASSIGGAPKVLDAWASTVNSAGGVGGHQVKVIAKDAGAS